MLGPTSTYHEDRHGVVRTEGLGGIIVRDSGRGTTLHAVALECVEPMGVISGGHD